MGAYRAVLERLYALSRSGQPKYALTNMRALCAFYGEPNAAFPCVHVTGTNGKGSMTFKLAQVLHENGLKVGIFQSPHVTTFRERVAIGNELIERSFVEQFLSDLFRNIDAGKVAASFFEALTVMAFAYFREKRVDIACIEVGIGGRLDATNVLKESLLSVITSVGLDHCELLGNTPELIATEKCGIIRPGSAALAGPTVPASVFNAVCEQVGAEAHRLDEAEVRGMNFREANIALVERAVAILRGRGLSLPRFEPEWLQRDLKCRMENVPLNFLQQSCKVQPLAVYLDCGHNPQAIDALLPAVAARHPQSNIRVVYGTSSKKDSVSTLDLISRYVSTIALVCGQSTRSKPISELAKEANDLKLKCDVFSNGDVRNTLKDVFARPEVANEIVVVCGSFFLLDEARAFFGFKDERDPLFFTDTEPVISV